MTPAFFEKNKRRVHPWRRWALRLLLGFAINLALVVTAWGSSTDYTPATLSRQLGMALPVGSTQVFSSRLPHKRISYAWLTSDRPNALLAFISQMCSPRYGVSPLTIEQMRAEPDAVAALLKPHWWQPEAAAYAGGALPGAALH